MTKILGFSCIRCSASYPGAIDINSRGCPACEASAPANLQPIYARKPQASQSGNLPSPSAGNSLWRFATMLPCTADEAISLGEGQTPLLAAEKMGRLLGLSNLAIKDEGRNPSWSHKDRFSTVAVSVARQSGARVVATASSGNAGASLAAYAARAGMACVVVTFAGSAGPMLAQIKKYGATVLPLANKRDRWTMLEQAVSRFGWFVTSPYRAPVVGSHPLGIEGYKTIAFEIVEQSNGRPPDWCVLPVCYGDALAGIWAGFKELHEAGAIDRLPRLVAAEVHGSLSHALENGLDRLAERDLAFDTLAVSIGTPKSTYQALKALRESTGHAVPVGNDGLIAMQKRLARSEGIFAELAAVTPFVAIDKLRKQNIISSSDHVVAIVTASGLKDVDRSAEACDHGTVFQTTAEAWRWLDQQTSAAQPG